MLNEEIFTCMICSNIFIKPVYCKSCKNSFCLECYKDLIDFNNKQNKDAFCPLCKKQPLEVEPNDEMERLIRQMIVMCKKCNLSFNSFEEYAKHNNFCKKLTCKICNLQFNNIILFIEHLENKELHLNIVSYSFDSNDNDNWGLIYANDIAKMNKIHNNLNLKKFKNEEYVNFLDIKEESKFDTVFNEYKQKKMPFKQFSKTDFFKSNCEKVGKDFINKENKEIKNLENIPPKSKYYKKYDLFYCFEKTNIDCNCCPEHICKPGSCMCKDCMIINLKYHNLKSYFSINKEKRACKYTNKSFRCHNKYLKITEKANGNKMINESFCHGDFPPCPACEETTKIMEYYIKPELIMKLKSYD